MEKTRKHFSQDFLIKTVRDAISNSLLSNNKKTPKNTSKTNISSTSDIDCIMSALAIFVFKYPSMLMFDELSKSHATLKENLKNLFGLKNILSDTRIRERVDEIDPLIIRKSN